MRLTKFAFPFSGKTWDTLQVQNTGLIGFGGGYNRLGFDRFIHMQTAGPAMVNKIPVIAAFMKLRMNGTRYVNELDDRLVVTWDLSEPASGQQDVTFVRTPHHFQAVLHRDGRIDLSYQEMTARDAVVGVYTVPPGGAPPTQSVDLSSVKPTDAPRPVIFETFHHYGLPGSESMACSVIQALGDRFDFMVWYSDFRVDDQEAGTRSVGEIGQKVSGIGPRMDIGMRLQDYCSQGRLQVTWFQPVWAGIRAGAGSSTRTADSPDTTWPSHRSVTSSDTAGPPARAPSSTVKRSSFAARTIQEACRARRTGRMW